MRSRHVWRSLSYLVLTGSLVGLLVDGKSRLQAEQTFRDDLRQITVNPPPTQPPLNQASVDLALTMFGIKVPSGTNPPIFDSLLEDRGLTTRIAFGAEAEVKVGPAAFASWALLGSTLAHELEVHCQQNFLIIHLMDTVGLDGTGAAERQAYLHELANRQRFGLTPIDVSVIADTMDYYYPVTNDLAAAVPVRVRAWLARTLVGQQSIL